MSDDQTSDSKVPQGDISVKNTTDEAKSWTKRERRLARDPQLWFWTIHRRVYKHCPTSWRKRVIRLWMTAVRVWSWWSDPIQVLENGRLCPDETDRTGFCLEQKQGSTGWSIVIAHCVDATPFVIFWLLTSESVLNHVWSKTRPTLLSARESFYQNVRTISSIVPFSRRESRSW
jgi:hypothetical protein